MQRQKKWYGLAAALFVLSACAGAGSAYMFKQWRLEVQAEADRYQGVIESCRERGRTIRGTVAGGDGDVRFIDPNVEDPYAALSRASVLMAACPGWSLQAFCMGTHCAPNGTVKTDGKADDPVGIFMILRPPQL